MAIEVGQEAPDFTLKNGENEEVSLSSFRGKRNVVLAFYPLAFSGVCTAQFTRFGETEGKLAGEDAQVIGVSVDSHFVQGAFGQAVGVKDTILLADFEPKGAVAREYGVYRDEIGFSTRAIFVIDKDGVVKGADVMDSPPDMPDEEGWLQALSYCSV